MTDASPPQEGLSVRDRLVLALVEEGCSSAEILDRMVLSGTRPATHMLRVVRPGDGQGSREIEIAVPSDEYARAWQRHVRGWTDCRSKVFLYRADQLDKPLSFVWGSRETGDACA